MGFTERFRKNPSEEASALSSLDRELVDLVGQETVIFEKPKPTFAERYADREAQITNLETILVRGTLFVKEGHAIKGIKPDKSAKEVPLTPRQRKSRIRELTRLNQAQFYK